MIAFDLEIVRRLHPDRLDRDDSIPVHIGSGEPLQLGGPQTSRELVDHPATEASLVGTRALDLAHPEPGLSADVVPGHPSPFAREPNESSNSSWDHVLRHPALRWSREHPRPLALLRTEEPPTDQEIEGLEVLVSRDRDDIAANHAASIRTIPLVPARHDPELEKHVLELIGESTRGRVVRRLVSADGKPAIALPHSRYEQREVIPTQFKALVGQPLRVGIASPQAETFRPLDCPTWPRAFFRRTRMRWKALCIPGRPPWHWGTFRRSARTRAVSWVLRVEVERPGGRDFEIRPPSTRPACAEPSAACRSSQGAGRCHRVPHLQHAELLPPGHRRVRRAGCCLRSPAEWVKYREHVLVAAAFHREYVTLLRSAADHCTSSWCAT